MTEAELGQLNLQELPPSRSLPTRNVDCFEKLEQIGQGTYGQVYMAKEVMTGQIVALKKIRTDNEKEGFPITAIREIKILSKLDHQNVVKLKEVVTSQERESKAETATTDTNKYNGSVYMVFEYMDHDLTGLADRPGLRFTVPQVKCYMKQLLTGLHYCHVNRVLHRDLKGANLLVDNNGSLKLADFGLAHNFSDQYKPNLTNRVVTLPYRPPELLLGATTYGPAVDIWSAGCILAELLHGKPIMFGKNEPEQLRKIFELCGSPDDINWPGVSKMPWYNNFNPVNPMRRRLRDVFRHFDPRALDLLDKMLTLDPSKRISAKDALDADYFWTKPLPCDPKCLPKYESSHEFQTKKKRQQQRLNEETAKRNKLQHPPPHFRLPPIQHSGRSFRDRWHESENFQQPLPSGPNNSYGNPVADTGQQSMYPSGNTSGGFNPNHGAQAGGISAGHISCPGRVASFAGTSLPDQTAASSYAAGPPGFTQSGQYTGSNSSRGPNQIIGNRNQQYGWQQ